MKKSLLSVFAAGALAWGLGACSSTSTENTTNSTPAVVTTNDPESATRAGEVGVAFETNPDAGAIATTLDTTRFAVMAASSDLFETLSSEMEQQRGANAEVKNYAQHMIDEHSKTSNELKSLAARKNITLPTSPILMHQQKLELLNSSKDSRKFDERYMEEQVMAHEQAITVFEKAAKKEPDPDLRAYAARTLPALRMHLDMAKKTKELVD
jgi:putative membrane protein